MRLGARASTGEDAEFGAAGTTITFRGFLAAYEEGRDDDAAESDKDDEKILPPLGRETGARGARQLEPEGRTTTTPPPATRKRRSCKALEERGIGRPSTYASIIGTILDRGYVFKRGTALVPTFLAFAVRRCSSSISRSSSTTTSPRGWKTTSTASPTARRSASTG